MRSKRDLKFSTNERQYFSGHTTPCRKLIVVSGLSSKFYIHAKRKCFQYIFQFGVIKFSSEPAVQYSFFTYLESNVV